MVKMIKTSSPFLNTYADTHIGGNNLYLGEVYKYLLSEEWGKMPELPINKEMPALANTCDSVHYEKPKTGKDESEK